MRGTLQGHAQLDGSVRAYVGLHGFMRPDAAVGMKGWIGEAPL